MPLEPSGVPSRAGIQAAIDEAVADRTAALPYAEAAGTTTISLSDAASGTTAVTFPASRFSAAPIVTVTPVGTSVMSGYSLSAPTTSGMTVGIRHVDGTAITATITVHWTARQMTETTGAG